MFVLTILACALFAETAQPFFVTRRSIVFTNLGVDNQQDIDDKSRILLTVTLVNKGDNNWFQLPGDKMGDEHPRWPDWTDYRFEDLFPQDISNVTFRVESFPGPKLLGSCYMDFTNYQQVGANKRSLNFTCGLSGPYVSFEVVVPVELQPCGERNVESGVCSSSVDILSCFLQPNNKSCALDCPSAHFMEGGGVSNRQCLLKPFCGQRILNMSADRPCGNNCNLQPNGISCDAGCPAAHYKPSGGGSCVLKLDCGQRSVDTTADTPCGNGCNLQLDGETCGAGCPTAHYTPSDGVCILKPECVNRGVNSTTETPCGIDCYLLQESLKLTCVSNCPDTHTGDETGVCVMSSPKPNGNNGQVNVAAIIVPIAVVVTLAVVGGL